MDGPLLCLTTQDTEKVHIGANRGRRASIRQYHWRFICPSDLVVLVRGDKSGRAEVH